MLGFFKQSRKENDPEASQGKSPAHIAVIMDGNGRWAKARGLPRTAGHQKGAEAVKTIIEACGNLGVQYLTLYTFSSENWERPKDEVNDLMNLLRYYIAREINDFHQQGARLRMIGDRSRLSGDILKQIDEAEKLTEKNTRVNVTVALSYGGRQEIIEACRKIAGKVSAGEMSIGSIDESVFNSALYCPELPDPDLLIRTGGDTRVSNFLLWQLAYAELYFTPTLWPDFDRNELEKAIEDFTQRERRYGKR